MHFDVYFNEKDLHDRGELRRTRWTGCASRATSTRPTARSGCAPPTSATTRTGCCASRDGDWTYFAADCAYYLDKRERGFDRVVYHARRRPPRLHRPAEGDGRLLRRRPGHQPGDPHRPDGQPGPRRRAGADEQAGRHRASRWRTWSTRSASTRPGTRWPATRPTRRSTSTSSCGPGPPATTRSTTCSTSHARTASVARNAAEVGLTRGERGRLPARAARPREGERPAQGARRVPGGGGQPRPSCASRTGSPATWRSWPAPTTGSTTTAGCCRCGDEAITDLHRARLWLNDATRTVIANGLGLLGVSAPERM